MVNPLHFQRSSLLQHELFCEGLPQVCLGKALLLAIGGLADSKAPKKREEE